MIMANVGKILTGFPDHPKTEQRWWLEGPVTRIVGVCLDWKSCLLKPNTVALAAKEHGGAYALLERSRNP